MNPVLSLLRPLLQQSCSRYPNLSRGIQRRNMASIVDATRTTISENLGGVAKKLAPPRTQFTLEEVPDQSGKVALITGGDQGIGYGVTHGLLSKNISKVIILSFAAQADEAREAIKKELCEDKASRVTFLKGDLGEWKKLPEIAEKIKKETDRLDVMVGNAGRGIMAATLTDYGVDRHMAVNHFGHTILTSHLLPLLKSTAEAGHTVRVSLQASNAHELAPKDTDFTTLEGINKDAGPNGQYGRAKLANILYARYLARHLTIQYPKILVNATHPGVVSTDMSKNDIHEPYPLLGYGMSVLAEPFKKDQFEGARSTLYAVTKTEGSGDYICPPAAFEEGSELSRDEQLGEQLMKLTHEVIREKTGTDLKFY